MRLDTTATLDQIRQKMTADTFKPSASTQRPGWGSYLEGDEILNIPNFTPEVHPPILMSAEREEPETLAARFYYFRRQPLLRRMEPVNADPARYHVLKAVDVLISPVPDAENSFTVLVASWDRDETTLASIGLRNLINSLDDAAILYADTSVLDLIDDDFFLWLVRRAFYEPIITEDMELDGIRHMDTKDSLNHTVNMGAGIDSTRGELLYLVAQESVHFGPGKLNIAHDRIGLNVDLELRVDGGFSVTMKSTVLLGDDDDKLSELEKRIRAFQQSAHIVIPELKTAYQRDRAWHEAGRAEFRESCRAETNRRTSA